MDDPNNDVPLALCIVVLLVEQMCDVSLLNKLHMPTSSFYCDSIEKLCSHHTGNIYTIGSREGTQIL